MTGSELVRVCRASCNPFGSPLRACQVSYCPSGFGPCPESAHLPLFSAAPRAVGNSAAGLSERKMPMYRLANCSNLTAIGQPHGGVCRHRTSSLVLPRRDGVGRSLRALLLPSGKQLIYHHDPSCDSSQSPPASTTSPHTKSIQFSITCARSITSYSQSACHCSCARHLSRRTSPARPMPPPILPCPSSEHWH